MNVLILIREFNPGEPVSEYCRALAHLLLEEGMQPHVICFDDRASDQPEAGIWVHRVPLILHGDNLFDWGMLINVEFVRKVRELADRWPFDLIHANDWITLPAGMVSSKLLRLPLIITFHSIEHERGMRWPHSGIISNLEFDGASEAAAVLVNNQTTYRAIGVFGLPAERVWLISPREPNWQMKVLHLYRRVIG
jgi:hypothetical protein